MAKQKSYESTHPLNRDSENLMKPGKKITLIPLVQARKGEKFIARISLTCRSCPNYSFCAQQLRPGFTYEVKRVRDVKHFCPAAKSYMVIAEVQELPLKIAVLKKYAVEGAIINFPKLQCKRKCSNKIFCLPEGIKSEEKVKILKILPQSLRCPLGYDLAFVLVQPLS
ncbi:MAG: hypothetical protein DRJ38_02500 [Thermoprotei archaeon]|nr:MAG: hypothetical protein DRJ38_02500 [Thermoprotei archaeon]